MWRLAALCAIVYAQGGVAIGRWGVYAHFGYVQDVAYVPPYFWCLGAEGIALIDAERGTYTELTRANGLLYAQPTAIYGDPYSGQIFIGYEDGRVQYGSGPEQLEIFRDIAVNTIYTARAIRGFHAKGDTLAIATDFGIVFWQKSRRRVLGSVSQLVGERFATPVERIRWVNGQVWACTRSSLYRLRAGLPWVGPWEKISGPGHLLPDSLQYWRGWAETPEGFLLLYKDTLLRWEEGNGWQLHPPLDFLQGKVPRFIAGERGGWAIAAQDTNILFFSGRTPVGQVWNPGPQALWCDPTAQYWAVATNWTGAIATSPQGQVYTDSYQRLRAGSVTEVLPLPQGVFFLHGGSTLWGSSFGAIATFYPHGAQRGQEIRLSVGPRTFFFATEAVWDGSAIWVGTEPGILRISLEGTVDTFTAYNSPFDGILPDANGKPMVLRFKSLARDANGTLWAVKELGERNICFYVPARRAWQALPYQDGSAFLVRIDTRGYKWVLYRNGNIRVIDDRGSPDNLAGYRSVLYGPGGRSLPGLPSTTLYALAADRSGAIWLGTDKGVAVLYGDPFDGTLTVSLPVVENRYLLEEETITDIAVDGQNRKWVGTFSRGVYVLSPEGNRQIANFDNTNSPLPSNLVYRIRPWDLTGEVFMITAGGTVSYRDWATEPSESLDSLHIFPNPVSRGFSGWVGIRGLSEGSTVRIFTPDGQQVRLLRSFGGQAVWDLRTVSGERVNPGLYLVGAIDAENRRSAIGKIIVID